MSERRYGLVRSVVSLAGRRTKRSIRLAGLLTFAACAMAIAAASAGATPSPLPLAGQGLGTYPGSGSIDAIGFPENAPSSESTRVPGRYIVVLEDSVAHPGAVAEAQTEQRDGDLGLVYRHALKGYSAELSKAAVDALRLDPRVKYVAPDRKVEVESQTLPTGIDRIFATGRGDLDIDETDDIRVNADVAVIDTGVDYTHPDLNVFKRTNCVPLNETEFEAEVCIDNSGTDGYGHGTHVAGTIGALDNEKGVVGVAPGARLWAVKVLGSGGSGYESWIVAGVDWVTAHASEIEVANMSLGCLCAQPVLEEAIEASVDAGVVYAVAAGNDGQNAAWFSPAANPDVITVSALADSDGKPGGEGPGTCFNDAWGEDQELTDDTLARFSNWGPDVEVAAPGVCILSTVPLGGSLMSPSSSAEYASVSGTSMASPHVAGVAAILASESNPNSKEDVEAIRERIVDDGNFDWEDTSPDGEQAPLLDLRPPAPEAVTTRGTSLDRAVLLSGVVKPGGLEATYRFEYGATSKYGQSIPAAPKSVGAGVKGIKVTEILGLPANGTYHYRIVVTTSAGTIYGKDRKVTPQRWAVQTVPGATGGEGMNSSLNAVSCVSATECWGVGVREAWAPYRLYSFAKRWSKGAWSTVSVPTPAGPKAESMLRGVSCVSTTACMAVGISFEGFLQQGTLRPYATVWDGSAWSITPMPMPAKAEETVFTSVSCTEPTSCTAAGYYVESGAPTRETRTLVEVWDGVEWTIQSSPNREGEKFNELIGVSCSSSAACSAVGGSFVERWNGSSWSIQPISFPEGKGSLQSVSCTASNACVATGTRAGKSVYENLVASWDGTKWTTNLLGDPGILDDVSCTSPTSCDATGVDYAGVIARHWDGSEWLTDDPVPSPEGAEYQLNDISCTLAYECTTVGYYGRKAERFEPVAQRSTPPPSVTTASATPEAEGATLGGTVNPNGYATTYQIEYGSTTSYGSKVPVSPKSIGSGTAAVAVSESIGGLKAGTYHYRVAATNIGGQIFGQDMPLTITAVAPSASVEAASSVAVTKATLNAAVNPHNAETTYQFEYGPTTSYGSKAPVSAKSVGAGATSVKVSEAIAGLSAATTYHYRVVATNSLGTTNSADGTFTTKPVTMNFSFSFGKAGTGNGQFVSPSNVAVDAAGDIWVTDLLNHRLQKFNSKGEYLGQFGKNSGAGKLEWPSGIDFDSKGNIWVTDIGHPTVQKFNSKGEFLLGIPVNAPTDVAVDSKDNIWVADPYYLDKVNHYSSTGTYLGSLPGSVGSGAGKFNEPAYLAIDDKDHIWVAEFGNKRVQQFGPEGEYLSQFGSSGTGDGQFKSPSGIDIGPDGNLWVSDMETNRIQEFSPAGKYLTKFGQAGTGPGQFGGPCCPGSNLAANQDGSIWVVDGHNNRVQNWVPGE